MTKFHSLLPVNDGHLVAMGRIAILWTQIEKNFEFLVWQLAPLQQPMAQAVTTHLSNPVITDIAKSLVNEVVEDEELKNRLKTLINYITNELRPKRNKVIHGIWGPKNKPGQRAIVSNIACY